MPGASKKGGSADEWLRAAELRGELVDALVAQRGELGKVLSGEVLTALRAVPRHLFLPGVPLAETYANDSVVTKRDADGVSISSVSAPSVVATMLDQLRVEPGCRVLEIGSGGYNAALLRELVGADGEVTSIDIDPEVIDRARGCLAAAGYGDVWLVCADGEFGCEQHAPFDRIMVTVGTWDIPPAWGDQLAEGGRLVVPLRVRGLTRSVALERSDGRLVSRDYELCGFVPMQGAGQCRERLVLLHGDEVGLRVDDGRVVDAELLRAALAQPRVAAWSGVTVGNREPFDDQDLWLAATLPDFCLLTAQHGAVERGLVCPSWRMGTPAVVEAGSFAYRTLRPVTPDKARHEFGVYAHGPIAQKLAEQVADQIRIWDRDYRAGPGPWFEVYPAGTPSEQLPDGLVDDKRHTRVMVCWP